MSVEQKEDAVRALGSEAAAFMQSLKAACNRQIEIIDSGEQPLVRTYDLDASTKARWKSIHRKNYEELLDVILKLCRIA